jgi:hypothetical protein
MTRRQARQCSFRPGKNLGILRRYCIRVEGRGQRLNPRQTPAPSAADGGARAASASLFPAHTLTRAPPVTREFLAPQGEHFSEC